MHVPDGFLDTRVWATALPVAAIGVSYALKKTNQSLDDRQVPLLGVTGAFIFAAQMINFPVAPGASGHLMGGLLAALLVGPHAAALVLTVVLGIQALVFQDGGLTSFGANVLNMAIIATYGGYGIARAVRRLVGYRRWRWAAAIGAWTSVIFAALACAVELTLSGHVSLGPSVALLCGVHVVIGIGEAVITVGVLSFVYQTRPDLVAFASESNQSTQPVHETEAA